MERACDCNCKTCSFLPHQPSHHRRRPFCPHFRCPCTCRTSPPCINFHNHHHHHHHYHHPFFCPSHSHRFLCPTFHTHFPASSIPPPVPRHPDPASLPSTTISPVPAFKDASFSTTRLQERTVELYGEVEEEEDEEEPVFVMTDEWMEFFAKSEAKRRLERQAQKRANK